MDELKNQIERLTSDEKAELLDTVWTSLEAERPLLTEAQRGELDRRIARYEQGPEKAANWEQVRNRVSERD